MEVGRKPLVLMLVFLFVVAGLAPTVSASLTGFKPFQMNQHEPGTVDNSHLEYYNITIYRFNGFTYRKTVEKVPYEVAVEIKQRFNNVDASFGNSAEKTEKKLTILEEYGLISREDVKRSKCFFKKTNTLANPDTIKEDDVRGEGVNEEDINIILFADGIIGTIGPNINNGLNFFFLATMFQCRAKGCDLTLPDHIPSTLTTDKQLVILFIVFFGLLLVFPFVSPGGIINGAAMFGWIVG